MTTVQKLANDFGFNVSKSTKTFSLIKKIDILFSELKVSKWTPIFLTIFVK